MGREDGPACMQIKQYLEEGIRDTTAHYRELHSVYIVLFKVGRTTGANDE